MKGYKETIMGVAHADFPADMFVRSSIVAYIFEKPKDKVLDDMIEIRRIQHGIPKRK